MNPMLELAKSEGHSAKLPPGCSQADIIRKATKRRNDVRAFLAKEPRSSIRAVAEALKISESASRNILAGMFYDGILTKETRGPRKVYQLFSLAKAPPDPRR